MGDITPVLSTLGSIAGTIDATRSAVQSLRGAADGWGDSNAAARKQLAKEQALAMEQLKARQSLDEQQSAADAAQEKEKIALDAQNSETARRAALKRAVARQRAQFGAQGAGSADGSAQAVLLGLFDESDAERAAREKLDTLRTSALESDLAQRRQLNLLQLTQMAARQNLDRLSRFA